MENERTSLNLIREHIKEKGAKWKAGKTSVSELSSDIRRRRLGLIPTKSQLSAISKLGLDRELASRSFEQSRAIKPRYESIGLPSKIDWRDIQGNDWTTSIKDQGNCGSCVAFGTISTLEALLKIRYYEDPDKDIDLSEAHLLWCGGGSCDGWNMDDACGYLKKNGVPVEDCFPYNDTPMNCQDTCPDWESKIGHTKISDWANTLEIQTMKERLVNVGPQITGMAVFSDFFYYKSGIYQHAYGSIEGYHCVSVVGFDDDEECWICKNSWNTGWGESGFFRIAYGECGIDDAFGFWNMIVEDGEAADEGDAQYIAYEIPGQILYLTVGEKILAKKEQDATVVNLLMQSDIVHVFWDRDQITSLKCIKKY